jgi:F-type H+-transporting ATPase subunit delta
MTLQAAARRYAAALFDVASANGTLDRAERDLQSVLDLLAAHPTLQQVFETPTIPAAKKRAVLQAVLTHAGDLGGEVRRTLELLADRDRLALISLVAVAFRARLDVVRRHVAAEVVTAVPMADDRRAALEAALGQITGGTVSIAGRVDPAIIGGLVAKVGSVVYDGSVTRQLERMRERLLADV